MFFMTGLQMGPAYSQTDLNARVEVRSTQQG